MGCGSCGSHSTNGLPAGCNNNGSCGTGGCNKLEVFDWLANMELAPGQAKFDIAEIRFKNSRKEFFVIEKGLTIIQGDVVAVEGNPGHDIGIVSITGELVKLQLKKRKVAIAEVTKKVYRKAKQTDIEKWQLAQALEVETMYKARKLALDLGLQMKISDVEYQGDKTKAIFYYTADDRVDFRELIKVMAQQFNIRIEMRQIGARQEASRLGGIGSCGRELCCSTWLTDFRTVNTSAARYQQLSLNPLKLAGQCGKLKCCLNYELDSYTEALKEFPDNSIRLHTKQGDAFFQKSDIFNRKMFYSYTSSPDTFIELGIDRVKEIQEANKNKISIEALLDLNKTKDITIKKKEIEPSFENVVGQDDLNRFDYKNKKPNKKPNTQKTNTNSNSNNQSTRPINPTNPQQAQTPNKNSNKPNPKSTNSNNINKPYRPNNQQNQQAQKPKNNNPNQENNKTNSAQ